MRHTQPLPTTTQQIPPRTLPHRESPTPTPFSLSHNFDPKGHPVTIHVSSTDQYQPWCNYASTSNAPSHRAFCKSSCHPYCPNHYSAFRTIPHQRLPPHFVSSCLLATAGVASHTPILEIASEIQSLPSDSTFPITPNTIHMLQKPTLSYALCTPLIPLTATSRPSSSLNQFSTSNSS